MIATRVDLVGQIAGGPNHAGYCMLSVAGESHFAHRLAWLYMTGFWPVDRIDHKDGVPSNNAWSNLRQCGQSQNGANTKLSAANTSGFKGVTYCKNTNRWRAKITHNGKTLHIGRFDSLQDAEMAYKSRAVELFGEFVRPL